MRPPKIRDEGGVLIVKLDDASALNDGQTIGIRQSLFQAVQDHAGARVAVDLGAIGFLSSSGVALLIGLKRRVESRGGRLVLFRAQPVVVELFRVMKLADFFTVAAEQEDAVKLLPPIPSV